MMQRALQAGGKGLGCQAGEGGLLGKGNVGH
jgi:hypothetical protein